MVQVQAEQALQNITAAMQQASSHSQEAAQLKKQLANDQVCLYLTAYTIQGHMFTDPLVDKLSCRQLYTMHSWYITDDASFVNCCN